MAIDRAAAGRMRRFGIAGASGVVLVALVRFFGSDYRIANPVGFAAGAGLDFLAGECRVFRSRRRRAP